MSKTAAQIAIEKAKAKAAARAGGGDESPAEETSTPAKPTPKGKGPAKKKTAGKATTKKAGSKAPAKKKGKDKPEATGRPALDPAEKEMNRKRAYRKKREGEVEEAMAARAAKGLPEISVTSKPLATQTIELKSKTTVNEVFGLTDSSEAIRMTPVEFIDEPGIADPLLKGPAMALKQTILNKDGETTSVEYSKLDLGGKELKTILSDSQF